ncbi:MAG: glycosyltransferase [uncultured bacterium]|nr:MAG: glycosyltransferase [uncultured bacterium]
MDQLTRIIAGEKIRERVRRTRHPVTQKVLKIVSLMDYDLFVHKDENLAPSKPIFTLILTIYDANIQYIEKSLHSVFEQTYKNTEVILINNGARGKVQELIWNYFVNHKNSKLICTKKNLYNPAAKILSDPVPNLWNAGLFCSVGNFIYFLSYDDAISPNYTEEMVQLFIQNEKCCTAAPAVMSINELGEINEDVSRFHREHNLRGRYTNGVSLAKSHMRGENKISFPGGLLAIKSSVVLDCGCFDSHSDLSQLFKFAICGESGFSPKAILYWRHHSGQAHKIQRKMGLVYYRSLKEFNKVYHIQKLHETMAGTLFAEEYERYIDKLIVEQTITAFRDSYTISFYSGLKAWRHILLECPFRIQVMALRCYLRDFSNYFRRWPIARFVYHKFFKNKLKKSGS